MLLSARLRCGARPISSCGSSTRELEIARRRPWPLPGDLRPLQAPARRRAPPPPSRPRTRRRRWARSPRPVPESRAPDRGQENRSASCSAATRPIPRGEADRPAAAARGARRAALGPSRAAPGLRQAEQQLVAANANVGAAMASFFPTISLTGLFGGVSPEVDNLFRPARPGRSPRASSSRSSRAAALRSQYDVASPSGNRRGPVRAAVTSAFAETTTVLFAREKLGASVVELTRTVDEYREMVRLEPALLQRARRTTSRSSTRCSIFSRPRSPGCARRLDLLNDYVDIYKALGGGWNLQPDDPNPTWLSPAVPAAAPAATPAKP